MANKNLICKAIKKYCLDCCCNQPQEVSLCPAKKCPLWPYRKGPSPEEEINVIIRALKDRCLDCCCFDKSEVKKCELENCYLHPYRTQKERKYATEEEKARIKEYFAKLKSN